MYVHKDLFTVVGRISWKRLQYRISTCLYLWHSAMVLHANVRANQIAWIFDSFVGHLYIQQKNLRYGERHGIVCQWKYTALRLGGLYVPSSALWTPWGIFFRNQLYRQESLREFERAPQSIDTRHRDWSCNDTTLGIRCIVVCEKIGFEFFR